MLLTQQSVLGDAQGAEAAGTSGCQWNHSENSAVLSDFLCISLAMQHNASFHQARNGQFPVDASGSGNPDNDRHAALYAG